MLAQETKPTLLFLLLVHKTQPTLLASVEHNAPEVIDDNEWRSQRRLVNVLLRQTETIEAPRLDAVLLNHLKRVATAAAAVTMPHPISRYSAMLHLNTSPRLAIFYDETFFTA